MTPLEPFGIEQAPPQLKIWPAFLPAFTVRKVSHNLALAYSRQSMLAPSHGIGVLLT